MTPIGVLVMAYGGPDKLEDVPEYLRGVRGGRPAGPEILEELIERYRQIGGRSPILERTRAQAAALERTLNSNTGRHGSDGRFRAYVGMRHWHPTIGKTLARMEQDGVERAVGLVMAPHYSRMSVGAYYKRIEDARSTIEIAAIERWHLCPGYLEAVVERIRAALGRFPEQDRGQVPVLFTAHSLPERILRCGDPYRDELQETVRALTGRLEGPERTSKGGGRGGGGERYHFAFQSAAMTPEPWLGPDAGEIIARLASEGKRHVLIVPIGFVCEHVEILYDVDVEFRKQAAARGMQLERIEMLNDAPALVEGLAVMVRKEAGEKNWL
ncbi:MAG: ferrochelatase [Acidobacteriota bacterium]